MSKVKRSIIISAAAALTAMAMSATAMAEIGSNYSNVAEGYGDSKGSYIFDVPYNNGTVSLAECSSRATVHTACYIRSQPGMDTAPNGVIQTGTVVRVWGVTDNDWAAVYTSEDGKTPLFGYIKKELLFDLDENAEINLSETDQSEAQIQTEPPAQTEPVQPAEQPETVQQTEAAQPETAPMETPQTDPPQSETADLQNAFNQIFG